MEDLGAVFSSVLGFFQMEFTLFGFTFSFWNVFLFSIVVSLVGFFLYEFFLGN